MLIVYLEHDEDMECPNDLDCEWRLYSFCTRHKSYKHPEQLGLSLEQEDEKGLPKVLDRKLRTKLKNGLAYWCSYYEHGQCWWGRKDGPIPAGVEFQWDGVRLAGLLIWEHTASEIGGKTYEQRAEGADAFLKRYTNWANGEGYCYSIKDAEGNLVDSCCGFDDADYMLTEIKPQLVGHEFEVRGTADYLANRLR